MRPFLITLLVIVLFAKTMLGFIFTGAHIFALAGAGAIPPAAELWSLAVIMAILISFYGLWEMRWWGVGLYLIAYLLAPVVSFYLTNDRASLPPSALRFLAVPLIYCAVVLPFCRRFS